MGGEGGAGVLMRDVVLFSLTGSAAKNCLREEEVLCDVLCRGSETQAAGTREKTVESEADGRDVRRQSGFFLRVFRRPLSICNES